MRERQQLEGQIGAIERIESDVKDQVDLIGLAEVEGDAGMVADAEATLRALLEDAEKRQTESMLSGEADGNDCYLEIHAGAGGTDAQD